jgi:4-amino-4-deoxychorismate lyase
VHVRLCTTRLSDNAALAGLKTLNRLDSVLARAEWRDARVWEGLMRDCEDNIVCGTMSNLFVRRGTSLMTPRLDRCGIAGVMRRWVLREAGTLEVDAAERRLGWHDLSRIDEAFMTNAVAGIVPVASFVRGRSRITLSSHVTAERLRKRLEAQ